MREREDSGDGAGKFPSWTSPVRIRSAAPFVRGLRGTPVAPSDFSRRRYSARQPARWSPPGDGGLVLSAWADRNLGSVLAPPANLLVGRQQQKLAQVDRHELAARGMRFRAEEHGVGRLADDVQRRAILEVLLKQQPP